MISARRLADAVEFDHLRSIQVSELDGGGRRSVIDVARPTMYLLVDTDGMPQDRIDAEIAWIKERLLPTIDLVLVWPKGTEFEPGAHLAGNAIWAVIDVDGEFRRLASPDGRRVAILVDAVEMHAERMTGAHEAFGIGNRNGLRAGDRTIDLGDVQH